MRAVVAAAVERPAYRVGPVRVEGPDEDGLTLTVAALERLQARLGPERPIERVAVVGPFPRSETTYLGEALGRPGLEVRSSDGGEAPLFAALAAAAHPRAGSMAEAVVAVDLAPDAPSPPHGAGAVAFAVAEGHGLEVLGHGERNHPTSRAPDAHAWVRAVRSAIEGEADPAGALCLRASAPPPVLLAFWKRALPRMEVLPSPPVDPSVGSAPHLAPALELLRAGRREAAGPIRLLAHIEPDRTAFAGFRQTGPVELAAADPVDLESPRELPGAPRRPSEGPGTSEGAYVARDRYLEELPSRWRFVAARCPSCDRRTFPFRPVCGHCGASEGLLPEPLPLDGGVVEARTTVRPGAQPTEFDSLAERSGGYDVVLVRLAPGVRATLQGTDRPPGTLRAGDRVVTRLRRLYRSDGEWRYGRKAIPLPVT